MRTVGGALTNFDVLSNTFTGIFIGGHREPFTGFWYSECPFCCKSMINKCA